MPKGDDRLKRRAKPATHNPESQCAGGQILSKDRGISDVVGYVLVVSLVLSVVGIVTVSGFASLEDARDVEQANNAERAFDVLSDNMADVYESGAPSRATEISLTEASLKTTATVTVSVSGNNTNAKGDNFTVQETSKTIVWEGNRNTQIAYSLGATLRDERQGGTVIGQPPFQLDPERTVIRVLDLRNREGRSYGGGTVRVRANHLVSTVAISEQSNDYDEVWLNVTTPRAPIWQQHLDRYPDTDCRVETKPAGETAICEVDDREELHITVTDIPIELEA
jgi:hypothetical protein